jgi:hypothetical protein
VAGITNDEEIVVQQPCSEPGIQSRDYHLRLVLVS